MAEHAVFILDIPATNVYFSTVSRILADPCLISFPFMPIMKVYFV